MFRLIWGLEVSEISSEVCLFPYCYFYMQNDEESLFSMYKYEEITKSNLITLLNSKIGYAHTVENT